MKIGEQTKQAHQQLPRAEHPALGAHGEKERGARRAQAEEPVPERVPAAPTEGAEHIVQKAQPQAEPGRGVEGKLQAIRFARENKIPCFGICMGMQCMAIEFARDVLGYADANSTEFDEHTTHNIIDLMEAQKRTINKGGSMRLGAYPCQLKEGSRVRKIYACERIQERHRHRYAKSGIVTVTN